MVKKWLGALACAALAVPMAVSFFSEEPARAEEDQDGSVEINVKNFPDKAFRAIAASFDTNEDYVLSQEELDKAVTIDANEFGIRDMTGIEYFTSLRSLNCDNNEITVLDVSQNTQLRELFCGMNALKELDVSHNLLLENLWCDSNEIRSLDLSNNTNLRVLGCMHNKISKLDLSHNRWITGLQCGNNELTELDVSGLENLNYFGCNSNHLTTLDVSALIGLVQLQVNDNQLTELKMGKHPVLDSLNTSPNDITVVDVRECPALLAEFEEYGIINYEPDLCFVCMKPFEGWSMSNGGHSEYDRMGKIQPKENVYQIIFTLDYVTNLLGYEIPEVPGYPRKPMDPEEPQDPGEPVVEIDSKNFPDKAFRAIVASFDKNEDMILSDKEINNVIEINAGDCEIRDLTGIEYFTQLRTLTCSGNKIKSLDVSKNTRLVELYCSDNELKEIDVTALTQLQTFWCDMNKITSLDLSKNTLLKVLGCEENKIKELDLSHNSKITGLRCAGNELTELDISNLKDLMYFGCERNKLTSLDVSFLSGLVQLQVESNQLTELKLGKHLYLETLQTAYNDITVIDVSKCPAMLAEFKQYGIKNDEVAGYLYCGMPLENDSADTRSDFDKTGRSQPKDTYYQILFTVDYATNLLGYEVPEVPGHPRKPMEPEGPTFEDFVERLYTVALDRESDPEGKAFWIKQVVEEGKTGADCARFFLLDAPEFMARNLSTEDFVETLYKTFFDRESDAAGKKGWIDAISSGAKTRVEVVNDFIESTEWCNVCATYGVKSGAQYHKATKPSKNATAFATRLYTCCLGRDPEAEGVEYWALALTNLEKTGAEAAQFFFESEEFVGFKTPIDEYLTRLYKTFMDREPASSEVKYWIDEIKAGRQNRRSILAFFAQSPEFTEICKKYGIDRGTIA